MFQRLALAGRAVESNNLDPQSRKIRERGPPANQGRLESVSIAAILLLHHVRVTWRSQLWLLGT